MRSEESVLQSAMLHVRRAQGEAQIGDLGSAEKRLRAAIDLLQDPLPSEDYSSEGVQLTSSTRLWGALANAYGMLGGVYRRMDRLDDAYSCYTLGSVIEEDPDHGLSESYNQTNLLVVALLLDPASNLSDRSKYRAAAKEVWNQILVSRRDEWWAWSDYVLLSALGGDLSGATQAGMRMRRMDAGYNERESTAEVLRQCAYSVNDLDEELALCLKSVAGELLFGA